MVFLDADTANIIKDAMRGLSYFLCEFIYELIVWMYKVFDRLCNSRILDSAALETIAERVGILLGLIMLFMVVFSVIQMVLEPDKLTDKEKGIGNILKKIILVMVMLGVSSSVFSLMYGIQKKVIASNVIQKFLLPYEVTGNESFGGVLSYNLFTSVYYYNVDNLNVEGSVESLEFQHRSCYEGFNKIETRLKNGEKDPFVPIETCVNKTSGDTYIMSFNWLLAPIIGGGVLYFIFSYCISIGIRTIQLAFLEIMAPMAIISYLSPKKDNMFQKWTKLYFSTYIDVFLRIMIINLIAFLIMTILESSDKWVFWNSVGGKTGTFADKAIWILMVFALLTFAKKAPDLLKDLFPAGASKLGLGISSPKKMFDNMLGGNFVKSIPGNTIGLLGKKTIAGFDAKLHGQNFKDGWKTPKGKFGTWIDKQRESYLPNYNEVYKKRIEGSKEIEQINTKWNKGVDIAKKLKAKGAVNHFDTTQSDDAWDKVLNGVAANRKYYDAIFSSDKFITSKMAVDLESGIEDNLRRGNQQIMSGGSFTWNGKTYSAASGNVDAFTKLFENQQKKVEGLKAVHDSMRKQYHKDAEVEDQYKFIKNNDGNPAVPGTDRHSKGIQ